MRSRKPFVIFWPQYFDAKRSRSKGRRIPRKFAIEKIDNNDILKAAMYAPSAMNELSWHFVVIDDKKMDKSVLFKNCCCQ